MAPRKGTKQAAAADGIVIAVADSNVSSPKKKKTTAKTVVEKPKQAKAGTRRAKAADKRENEVADNEADTSPVKKSRGRAKKVVTAVVKPKSPAKTITNSAKNKSKKINNKQKIKTDTEEDNAGKEVAQITEKKTRARATTKKAGAAKKPPAKSKTTLSTAKRSKKVTAIENGAGDAESVEDEGPSKTTTRRRKAAEKNVAPVATKSTKITRKRKNEDNKNLEKHRDEQIIEKEKYTEPIVKKSRRANKMETGAGDVVKLDQGVKVTKPKEKTKKKTAKKPDAKPETSTEEKMETEEEKNSQYATLQEDNVKEKSVKKTVTRRKPTATVTESKLNKRKININKKDETKKQKKEHTTTEEDDVMINYVQEEDLSINKNSTLKLDETVAEDNNLSGNDNANNNKEESVNKDSPETKPNFTEIERSPSFLSL